MPSHFPNMTEEYLLERLRDKDEATEDLIRTVTSLKKELLDVHDWIAEHVEAEKCKVFWLQKMQAQIFESVRLVPSENVS